jgi:protein-arginine kinase activator protein McsA
MRKINLELIAQIIFGLLGFCLMLIGVIIIGASLIFTKPLLFEGVVLMSMGAILFTAVKVYFSLTSVLQSTSAIIEKIIKQNQQFSPHQDSIVKEIVITEDTTPEEISQLKKEYPALSNSIDDMIRQIKHPNFPQHHKQSSTITAKDIITMTTSQLEIELQSAIANDLFETAAIIRDELKKRKT